MLSDEVTLMSFLSSAKSVVFGIAAFLIPCVYARGQMQSGAPQAQTVQAIQLPASGRTGQSPGSVATQQMPTQGSGATVIQPSVQVFGSFQGSIPGQESATGPVTLSLVDAVRRGLEVNLGAITASTSSNTAKAQRAQALSGLLPQIAANVGATETQINLAAEGLGALGTAAQGLNFPTIVGPFHYVQAEATINWNALNITSLRNWRVSKELERAAELSQRDARELIVLAVGGTYLQTIAAAARVESQRAQVGYAQAIYDQAQSQYAAGTNARIDVTRSVVQLQTEQERLNAFQGDYDQQKLLLGRLIGIPLDRQLVLSERLEYKAQDAVDEMGLLRAAFDHRMDLRAAESQLAAAKLALSAAHAERYPSISGSGYYGAMGLDPTNAHGVFAAAGSVNIPIYQGGKIKADIEQAEQTVRQREAEVTDQKQRVEQDVRSALIQLRTATGQIHLAQTNRQYALDTLTQARDRYKAGVTNTVEVVQAQQQESSAENDYISSLFAFNLAQLTIARATGAAESNLSALFAGSHP